MNAFLERYNKLNDRQKEAVDTIEGPVMVIAGPGTGKTELLSMRAANILDKTDVLPENILCLTFTDSGAVAMRERLTSIVGKNAYKVAIHTFHSFGSEVINQNRAHFYRGAEFSPADELATYDTMRKIFDTLDYRSPIASKMNGEYTYLSDALRAISDLKRAGMSPDELLAVITANDQALDAPEAVLSEIFAAKISKNTPLQIVPHLEDIRNFDTTTDLPGLVLLGRMLADSLTVAVNTAVETGKTTAVTAWRKQWMEKDAQGNFIFKSRARHTKLRALAEVYRQYLTLMEAANLYDFDDMILRVQQAMETIPELRYNLQEKYQYIMVDEFQDTNMAQMRILHALTDNPVNEGRPNILTVGDDDQAIYSFQGADVGNIISFRDAYPIARIITLTDNYRSAPVILERSRSVITQGGDRLEDRMSGLNKTLTPHKSQEGSAVTLIETATAADERAWLAASIQEQINQGVPPANIAVLARRHHEIVALLPYLADAGIRVNYERRDNVLDLDVIVHIELLARTIVALHEGRHGDADSRLPELLTHPAWGIDPVALWRLSLAAKQNRSSWFATMATTPEFTPLHTWLVTTAAAVPHMPLEFMLDTLTGHEANKSSQQSEPKQQDSDAFAEAAPMPPFHSPLHDYFFSQEKLTHNPDEYLTYLEALRTIRTKLRDHQPDEPPRLQHLLSFIDLHRSLDSSITSIRPPVSNLDDAVTLMTAHKSKGLEFDTVYTIGAVDSAWGETVRGKNSLFSYPENLAIAPAGNSPNERLRLFFVAMTRAKRQLFISYSLANDSGKDTARASFLVEAPWEAQVDQRNHTTETATTHAELQWYQPVIAIEKSTMQQLLQPTLERYKLSATHVGAFLDVTHGGPQGFLLQQLLRFPQAKGPHAGYGTAVHDALQRAHAHLSATGKHRAVEDILHDFETNLTEQGLPEADYHEFHQRGSDALQAFLEAKYIDFKQSQRAELDFSGQHAVVGEAHLTGKLDLVDIDEKTKEVVVTDYKTGKPSADWKGKSDYDKIKLHRYKQQLMFYKLLVEHSRDWSNHTVTSGVLQFVEPSRSGEIVALSASFTAEELERFTQLLQSIWKHITTLNLPDTSHYEPTIKGILAFEQDLIDQL